LISTHFLFTEKRMKDKPKPASPVLATIVMSMMSSVLCLIGILAYLIINWNNPIWTEQVRLFFIVLSVLGLIVTGGMIVLYRRIIR